MEEDLAKCGYELSIYIFSYTLKTTYRNLGESYFFSLNFGDWKIPKLLQFQMFWFLISLFGNTFPVKKGLSILVICCF